MNGVNRLLKVISTLVLSGIIIVVFSGFQTFEYKNTIDQLFKDRTDILQNSFYGKIKIEDTERVLGSVEVTPLIISDLQTIANLDPTEIDTVKSMKINKIKKIKTEGDLVTFSAQIEWQMQGLEGDYSNAVDYIIILKNEGNTYKISDYYPVI